MENRDLGKIPAFVSVTEIARTVGIGLPLDLCPFRVAETTARELQPWEQTLYDRAFARLTDPTLWNTKKAHIHAQKLQNGKTPFAKCRNPEDHNHLWGRYYIAPAYSDDHRAYVVTRQVPKHKKFGHRIKSLFGALVDLVDDVAEWVGKILHVYYELGRKIIELHVQLVTNPKAFLNTVVDVIQTGICNMIDKAWKRKLLIAGAIAEGLPPAAVDLAIRLARVLCAVLRIIKADISKGIKLISILLSAAPLLSA